VYHYAWRLRRNSISFTWPEGVAATTAIEGNTLSEAEVLQTVEGAIKGIFEAGSGERHGGVQYHYRPGKRGHTLGADAGIILYL